MTCKCQGCKDRRKGKRRTVYDWKCHDCRRSWVQYLHYPCEGRLSDAVKPSGGN